MGCPTPVAKSEDFVRIEAGKVLKEHERTMSSRVQSEMQCDSYLTTEFENI